ncbi:hypothetical protein, partial [Pseudomonas aeruginosa]
TTFGDYLLDLQVSAPQASGESHKGGGEKGRVGIMEIGWEGALVERSVADLDADLGMVSPFAAPKTMFSQPRLWAPLPDAIFYA